jgi:hypothetical protein
MLVSLSGSTAADAGSQTLADITRLTPRSGVARLDRDPASGRVVALLGDGGYRALDIGDEGARLQPFARVLDVRAQPPDMIPHGRVAFGRRDVSRAWLAEPTGRYAHGVLGDDLEAGTLRVETADGSIAAFGLDPASVFEDLEPRLADLDGDGRDEVLVVRSYLDRGAALAVFGLRDDTLVHLTETAPFGLANRWLNPVGVADFDGDGRNEAAVVITPHIGGVLTIYGLTDGKLNFEGERGGYSNHSIGSTALGLSAIVDLDGDGAADILLPDQSRRRIKAVGFAGGRFAELAQAAHPAEVRTAIRLLETGGRVYAAYGLRDGSLIVLRLPPEARPIGP